MDTVEPICDKVEHLARVLGDVEAEPIKISYAVIRSITKNFVEKIGGGGYGVVYLGGLQSGMVAVKELLKPEDDKIFFAEVNSLKRARHPNIVRFLGYCAETQWYVIGSEEKETLVRVQRKFLCFEYAQNGSLYQYLQGNTDGCAWNIRYQTIKGICQGLDYLHRHRIYHLDLKPANVLMGDQMKPKITDFGSSRCIDENQSTINITIMGTLVYMAPESMDEKQISYKTDIYSLGQVMINLILGSNEINEEWQESLEVACPLMKRCIEIARMCVDHDRHKRPSMEAIIGMLNEAERAAKLPDNFFEVLPVAKEPINDPNSSPYQAVQRFRALSSALTQRTSYGMEDIYEDLSVVERIREGNEEPSHLSYELLQFITRNFSVNRRICVNESGDFFKGILMVVKRLSGSLNIDEWMFHRHVQNLTRARHKNILRFLGYCSYSYETTKKLEIGGKIIVAGKWERLLGFEYISNGSLTKHLSDALKGLEWHIRYQIIKGICEGLCYLHSEDIIHMDLSPASILLDDHMVPKITDFGISELMSNERPQRPGYSAPECISMGTMSRTTDMYSLGVIIIELVTGSKEKPIMAEVLKKWEHRWNNSAKRSPLEYQQVINCLELAQSCLHENSKRRPDIWDVIRMLN